MSRSEPPPVAAARYNRYVVVEFDKGVDAKEFFYQLSEQMGYNPRTGKGKGRLPPGTGPEWALRLLSPQRAKGLTRKTGPRGSKPSKRASPKRQ